MYFSAAGFLTAIGNKFFILKFRDNVELQVERIILEIAIVISSIMYIIMTHTDSSNTLIVDVC